MNAFPFPIVGFDLDGTLFDTSADLGAAVNYALALAGRPTVALDAVKALIGGGPRRMLERGLEQSGGCDPDLLDRLYPPLLDHYRANIAVGTVPYPGLLAALDRLDALGVAVGIVTNKQEALAVQLVDTLGLSARFATIIGGDTLGAGNAKPNAAPIHELVRRLGGGRAAFVGDSIYDVMAAKNAGVLSVAVRFGFPNQPIETMGADAIIDSYTELISALERLGQAGG